MPFSTDPQGCEEAIIELFRATFTASEGAEEGDLIGDLVHNLLASTAQQDRFVFIAEEDDAIIGGILFSRLTYEQDQRTVFVLAPVAVATDQQGKGIGQRLLNHGLAVLRKAGVDIAMTYGDPGYYAKVGFKPISEADAPAPFKLQQPEGWLAQSLTDRAVTPLKGPSRCVEALNHPVYW
ncbi:GNAT family N-acetyltransferase [Lamprobacter modestohalophilus]|uniref:GNAT family N-acetyltransferase n=1 Tax=Lamprobacter modestohalophilus TaxID=1064514 RepID=A0A9X0WDH5_9GAMM|nr:N-acetyltransferase [Lamprobacter modestohalophilus]MBK1621459.1 GNAT family N-acetyltransferase [Lamprobacter modestohalophilus]